jgi:uncharacterized protein YbbK (DUF523 family)
MRLPHTPEAVLALRTPTASNPWRVLVSGCLAGLPCGVEGTDYGLGAAMRELLATKTLQAFTFCPEEVGMGTPRTMPDIHGGDGFDVLDGHARVLDEHGTDLTDKMLVGARGMLAFAIAKRVELAILTDMSAACGTQVISDGCRLVAERRYLQGVGVAAALLLRNGIAVVSQRDHRTLGMLRARLDPAAFPDPAALDHHETPWYTGYFRP